MQLRVELNFAKFKKWRNKLMLHICMQRNISRLIIKKPLLIVIIYKDNYEPVLVMFISSCPITEDVNIDSVEGCITVSVRIVIVDTESLNVPNWLCAPLEPSKNTNDCTLPLTRESR